MLRRILSVALPRWSMASCVFLPTSGSALACPFVASVGMEMVSGTPGVGVYACVVATVAEIFISGILMVFEWRAALVLVSVGHILMNSGDVLEVPYPCLCCDGAEITCSSCVCGYLRGDDSCSPICSIGALHLPVVVAFFCRFQPFVLRFQPFVLPILCVACSISRRQRSASKVWGKIAKVTKEPTCLQARKIEAQASSLIQAESFIALDSAELVEE